MTIAKEQQRPTSVSSRNGGPLAWLRGVGSGGLLVGALLLLCAIGVITTGGFSSLDNLRAILSNASIIGIVAVSMTFLTLSGNLVSLGIQQTTVLASMTFLYVVQSGHGVLSAIGATFLAAIIVGLAQGVVVALGMNTIITTLAAGAVVYGSLAAVTQGGYLTTGGNSLGWLGHSAVLGVPLAVYGFVVITVVATVVSHRTTAGRRLTLAGANRNTARLSGIRLPWTVVMAFLALSIGIAVAGILSAAQLGQATVNDLPTLTLDVIAAVLVGGTVITGGRGSPARSAMVAVIIAVMNNLMVLNDFSTGWRLVVQGALVVAVVSAVQLASRETH